MPDRRARGRPVALTSPERRLRILAAAEHVFLEHGYTQCSMDDIVSACGMSKKTVYRIFPTKDHLFSEMVTSIMETCSIFDPDKSCHETNELMLRSVLIDIARFIFAPRQVSLARLVLSESPVTPKLGEIFYERSIVRGRNALVDVLNKVERNANFETTSSSDIADFVMGGLVSSRFFAVMMAHMPPPSEDELSAQVDTILKLITPFFCFTSQPSSLAAV
jgi:AcrR family transcriptional regulator